MNDIQNQNSFDFVPKSDYNEKWHLRNKCLFHNQQFSEGDTYRFRKCTGKHSCHFCKHSDNKFKITQDTILTQKSGDWNREDEIIEHSSETGIQKPAISDWKWKNPYSVSNLDRSNFALEHKCSTSFLHDECNKRYEDCNKDKRKNILFDLREYLVNYQESCGVPRTEYSFSALIQIMGQATGRSLLALLYVMLNAVPLVEVLLYVLRFILDKMINIKDSKDFRQAILRCFVFTTELLSVYVCLIFIFGFIVLPIFHMAVGIIAKILLYK
ncbi:uncharacterized protein LOC143264474 [Megachile rotundata]|uniref:uncharacterized protein LOC143264474 n=1 Tax=Megachile rotundata TaxID=143995 RepID=UPI003FCFCCA0